MFKLRDMKVGATQNPGLSIYFMYSYTVIWNSEKVANFQVDKKCVKFKWKISFRTSKYTGKFWFVI